MLTLNLQAQPSLKALKIDENLSKRLPAFKLYPTVKIIENVVTSEQKTYEENFYLVVNTANSFYNEPIVMMSEELAKQLFHPFTFSNADELLNYIKEYTTTGIYEILVKAFSMIAFEKDVSTKTLARECKLSPETIKSQSRNLVLTTGYTIIQLVEEFKKFER